MKNGGNIKSVYAFIQNGATTSSGWDGVGIAVADLDPSGLILVVRHRHTC